MDIKIWRNKPRTTKSVSLVKLKTQEFLIFKNYWFLENLVLSRSRHIFSNNSDGAYLKTIGISILKIIRLPKEG